MIGIHHKGAQIQPVLSYNYKKVSEGNAVVLDTNIFSNQEDKQLKYYLNNFSLNTNSRTKHFYVHASLNFHPSENLSDEQLISISKDYISGMGYEDVPYTIFKHNDADHQHVHIVHSRIGNDGCIGHKDKFDLKRNKEVCKELEIKYSLHVAEQTTKEQRQQIYLSELNMQRYAVSNALQRFINSGRSIPDDVLHPKQFEKIVSLYANGKQPKDSELKATLKRSYSNVELFLKEQGLVIYSNKHLLTEKLTMCYARTNTLESFEAKLAQEGLYSRLRLDSNKIPYMLYGDKSKDYYITEKYLSPDFHHANLVNMGEYKITKAEQLNISSQKRFLSKELNTILPHVKSIQELELNLKNKGIDWQYDYTSNGAVIQGIKFSSSSVNNPVWFKGSEIKRSFSWSNISSKFLPITNTVENNDVKETKGENNPNVVSKLPINKPKLGKNKSEDEDEMEKKRKGYRDY